MTSTDGGSGEASGELERAEDLSPVDILLVEPNPGDTRLFTESFKEASIMNRIYVVSDGRSALDFLDRSGKYVDVPRPDIVLLDPQLPDVDGEAVVTALREDPAHEETAVVALTGSETEGDILRQNGFEADEYLAKPVEPDEFARFVRSVEEFWFAVVRQETAE
ncbi:response regulator [Halovivax sp.]|uniref:response regulator n=1 Tax=Halovivax sp. TaxID=1935978 RepID=UPI0025C698E5|nr:response regulator [Halovivax sp.]